MIIIDVGAADAMLKKQPGKVYVLFEPDPAAFNRLQEKHAGDPSIYIFKKGLWSEEADVTLYLTRKRQCSSLYKPNLQLIKSLKSPFSNPDPDRFMVDKQLKISVVRMDSILDQVIDDLTKQGHPKSSILIDKVKVDTQGSEYEILQGMGKYIDIVKEIEVEVEFVELYHGQKLFEDLDKFLIKKGFIFKNFLRLVQFNGVTVFGDAIYIKD